MTTTAQPTHLADLLDAPPLARRIAAINDQYAHDPRLDYDAWPIASAARILAEPEITTALSALNAVEELRARHQPRAWGNGSDVVVCSCGSGSYDACPEARVLAQVPETKP